MDDISIDYREILSGIPFLLVSSDKITVEVKKLEIGDYVIGGQLLVERKTHLDFIRSLISGRLFSQAKRLASQPLPCCILLEGKGKIPQYGSMNHAAVEGALFSLCSSFQIPILHSTDVWDSARIIKRLVVCEVEKRRQKTVRKYRYGPPPKSLKGKKLYLLEGLPGVGPKLARRILTHFGSIDAFFKADENQWLSVEGLGPKKVERIKKVLS